VFGVPLDELLKVKSNIKHGTANCSLGHSEFVGFLPSNTTPVCTWAEVQDLRSPFA
jgi:hypothetical protein